MGSFSSPLHLASLFLLGIDVDPHCAPRATDEWPLVDFATPPGRTLTSRGALTG
ncbi:MAG TPA: hypothetical protein V6D03_11760 [Candidatus Caenarcaniphilales bacterium]